MTKPIALKPGRAAPWMTDMRARARPPRRVTSWTWAEKEFQSDPSLGGGKSAWIISHQQSISFCPIWCYKFRLRNVKSWISNWGKKICYFCNVGRRCPTNGTALMVLPSKVLPFEEAPFLLRVHESSKMSTFSSMSHEYNWLMEMNFWMSMYFFLNAQTGKRKIVSHEDAPPSHLEKVWPLWAEGAVLNRHATRHKEGTMGARALVSLP